MLFFYIYEHLNTRHFLTNQNIYTTTLKLKFDQSVVLFMVRNLYGVLKTKKLQNALKQSLNGFLFTD